MNEKELKHMGWGGALQEIEKRDRELQEQDRQLADLQKKAASLEKQNAELAEKLDDRSIRLEKCGSIAEAAIQINGVIDAAQAAADQYLESIKMRESGAEQMVKELTDRTKAACEAQLSTTKSKCALLESESKKRAEGYWTALTGKLDEYYESHKGLEEMLEHDGLSIELPHSGQN